MAALGLGISFHKRRILPAGGGGGVVDITDAVLLEAGAAILLENGNYIKLE